MPYVVRLQSCKGDLECSWFQEVIAGFKIWTDQASDRAAGTTRITPYVILAELLAQSTKQSPAIGQRAGTTRICCSGCLVYLAAEKRNC